MKFVLIKVNPGDINVAMVDETYIINSQMANENTCLPHASHVMSHELSQSNTACGATAICQTTVNTRTRCEARLLHPVTNSSGLPFILTITVHGL